MGVGLVRGHHVINVLSFESLQVPKPRCEAELISSQHKFSANLDKLICHLGRYVDTFDIEFACLGVLALCGQNICASEVLVASLLSVGLRTPLCGERATVENDVGCDVEVPQKPDAVHRIVDIPERKLHMSTTLAVQGKLMLTCGFVFQ